MRGVWLVLVATMTAASTARADPGADAFADEVVAHNPSVSARALRRAALGEDAAAAGIYPDPQIAVMVDRVPESMGGEMPMVRYQATQMFPWPGKLGFMRAAIEHQRDAAEADVEVRKLDLRLEAKRAYYMLALNTTQRELVQTNRNLAATIAQAALGRYGTGAGSHHEVVRAQVEVSALDVQSSNLSGARASMLAMLNALRDRPADAPLAERPIAPSPTPDLTAAKLVARAYANRPELRGMRAMESEALAMADLARRERYPDVMGSVWLNQNFGAPASAGAMVGVTLPFFGVARQGHREGAQVARAQSAAQDAAAMRAMIRFEVADAAVRVQTADRNVELLEKVVLPRARESFEASLAGYGAGGVDVLALLDARRSLQTAALEQATARIEREIAIAALERALGGAP